MNPAAAPGRAQLESAVELLGRVLRDVEALVAVREASRPTSHHARAGARPDEPPAVLRAAIVALGLLGVPCTHADWQVAVAAMRHHQAAAILATTLASPLDAEAALAADVVVQSPGGALARRRVALGRLVTVVG